MYIKKQKHNSAKALVWKLTKMDDSWFQATTTTHDINVTKYKPKIIKDDADYYKNIKYNDHHETPLLLATARGIIEMVETIVKTDPQSMDYVTSQNRKHSTYGHPASTRKDL